MDLTRIASMAPFDSADVGIMDRRHGRIIKGLCCRDYRNFTSILAMKA